MKAFEHGAILSTIADLVTVQADLDVIIGPVLRMLSDRLELRRCTFARLDLSEGSISIHAAHGLTPKELRPVKFAMGEGLIGQVVSNGTPFTTMDVLAEPQYIDWTGIKQLDVRPSFCVRSNCGSPGGHRCHWRVSIVA